MIMFLKESIEKVNFEKNKPKTKKHANPAFKDLLMYSKTCIKWSLSKRPKIGFQYQLLLNKGQKHCRMLQVEHSAIL